MKQLIKLSYISFVALAMSSSLAFAADTVNDANQTAFSDQQTKQVESIVHNYIVKHPQVIVESMQNLQEQQVNKEKSLLTNNAQKFNKEIFNPNTAGRFSIGNPNGKVIMTEFFSYQCPNCRMMEQMVASLVKNNPELQVIFIAWPFENKDDVYAAKAVFAAQKQGKAFELHAALMNAPDLLTQESIDKIVKTIPGLNVSQMQKDMSDAAIDDSLKANFKLAQTLQLNFTPVFIFTNQDKSKFTVVPGRVEQFELKKAIKEVK